MKFPHRILIYFLLVLVPLFYRWKWNENYIFVSSDPQIKYYQVKNVIEGGSAESCYFPAGKIGFPLENIPVGYPWAFFLKNGKCVFQYPVLFVTIQKFVVTIFTEKLITYFPILIFFLNFLILDQILQIYEKRNFFILLTTILIHIFSPIFLSSLDYSELTLNNCFFLLSILSFTKFLNSAKLFIGILLAVSIVFNFQLRPESSIALVLFFVISFLYSKNQISVLRSLFPYIALTIVIQLVFFMWNLEVYGHFLGMRGLNTVNDMGSSELKREYLSEWIADLWGNDFKIGIFKGYPILFLAGLILWWRKISELGPYLISGLLFILFLPILSPYRAGVDIFGMRYYESGVYLLLIGILIPFWRISPKYLGILIILPLLYFSYKSDTRAIKIWSSSSKLYNEIMADFDKIKPDLIVHRGLSLSYLMGESYVKYPQISIYSNDDWLNVERIANKNSLKILYIQWDGNQLVKNEFPKKIWDEKFDINFQFKPSLYKIKSEYKIAHFQGYLLENKN
ncbi:hypothetical protein AB3N60_09900 [Leptospira sp. WS39.C2]